MIPIQVRKLRSLAGNFPAWMRSMEAWVTQVDNRVRNVTVAQAGWIVVWPGGTIAANALRCNGQLVLIDDHPDLFAVIGTDFNTGGETADEFRVPDLDHPDSPDFVYIIIG